MITIFFRTLIIYVLLIGALKLMGKRQIGQLEMSELITTLLLSELAVTSITDNNIPLTYAVLPIIMIISFEVISTFFVTKFAPLKRIFDGKPSYIIKKGALDQKELGKMRLTLDEFIGELRLKDISDLGDVNYAVLERNGQLSVFPKDPKGAGLSHPLVVDGYVIKANLPLAGKTEDWLTDELKRRSCPLPDAFLLAVDDNGKVTLIRSR